MKRKCTKKCFPSRGAALSSVRKIEGQLVVPLKAYWCGKCKAWHLTSKISRVHK